MKFQFTAIDQGGRVVRGVLRAENEEEAREFLLSENVFAKQLARADEEEKITWSPKGLIKARVANAATWNKQKELDAEKPVSAVFQTRVLAGHDLSGTGEAGLTDSGAFCFVPSGGDPFRVGAEEIEIVAVSGFPLRVLRLTLISGRMLEFGAGVLLTNGAARQIVKHFKSPSGKGRK